MQIQRKPHPAVNALNSDTCAVIGVFDDHTLTPFGLQIDTYLSGALCHLLDKKEATLEVGESLFIPVFPPLLCKLLVVNCGNKKKLDGRTYQKILHQTADRLLTLNVAEIYYDLQSLPVMGKEEHWKVFQAAVITGSKFYRFDQLKSEIKPVSPIAHINFDTVEEKALTEANALINGLALVKDLGNLPGNICTPTYLAQEAQKLSQKFKTIKAEILEEKEMEALGMQALLAVGKGSKQPAKLICLHYQQGNTQQKPIVFVGKGITFDTGGISLKQAPAMDEMKFDMCGGATVFGILQTAAALALPLHIIGLIPAVENMPGSQATRPGDIVKSFSGKTIEILNTDAEGRLILCDTLTYAEKFSPEVVIDMATLTMGAILAFNRVANVIMGNNQKLIDELLNISEYYGERSWQLPLWEEYQEMLRSNFADIPNIHDDNNAKTIIAGCFLSRFTQNYPWAHLDIAGSAFIGGGSKEKGATGRPLMLLLGYLLSKVS